MRVRKVTDTANVLAMRRDDALIEAFAAELKARRGWCRLSQEDLAYHAGVNRTYIAKLELARNQPTLSIMFRLARALNCELPVLLDSTLKRHMRVANRFIPTPSVDADR